MNNFLLNFDILEEKKKEFDENAFLYKIAKAKKAGKSSVKINGKTVKVKMSDKSAEKITEEEELRQDESKGRRRPGKTDYYKGTEKSNVQMSKEIKKCAKSPRPPSCYKDWTADKTYRKSKKMEESTGSFDVEEVLNESLDLVIEEVLEEKKKRKSGNISAKTRETLRKKAKNANMPLGALTSVYRKGLAAWLTGHRQGIAQHQWAMARVNSFIRGGKTRSVDTGEWKKVQQHRK